MVVEDEGEKVTIWADVKFKGSCCDGVFQWGIDWPICSDGFEDLIIRKRLDGSGRTKEVQQIDRCLIGYHSLVP